ncbi:cyclic-di-AMP receptor [Inconstantimicrobium mannanitabidum]|uniref:Uncharacterized protein n=1 Tax=Inconstantimicrobium mannanitabidum TaxID=1604901 RepID=A0ACB5RI58_9CLOT|nr:cyclic-di-AMP receptor [Clostridium sp. TW13]GKX68753.1 hypothetical protein rsdtw13_40110 [Clostridium sp. TW13]
MKLVIAIVQDDDASDVIDAITDAGFMVTKLATTGGFLKSGNTTLMMGVEKEKVDDVIKVVKEICSTRSQIVSSPNPMESGSSIYVPYPIEVEVGGATVFVVDVDQFVKI